MKNLFCLLAVCGLVTFGCAGTKGEATIVSPTTTTDNPLLAAYETPFGVPPFDKIENHHYLPAFETALIAHTAEIAAIAALEEAPTFLNTVAALDYSGQLLTQVSRVFFNIHGADTNEELQAIIREIAPKLSAHSDSILMNAELFQRIEHVYSGRNELELTDEQARLLEETHKDFVRGGAELNETQKTKMAELNERLTVLSVQFGENLLAENNEFKLVIEDPAELSGLPENSIHSAAQAAKKAELDGKWIFTLHKPSWIPFLQFSDVRRHRETMFKGYIERGNHGNERDTKAILVESANLRLERAKLLGYTTHADYILEDNMAGTPARVYELLGKLWKAALPVTQAEAQSLQAMMDKDAPGQKLEPWDWQYYAEKLRKEQFDLSEDELKPYFQLENVQQGAFDVATKLFGLQFIARNDLPVYHEDVQAVEVQEENGKHLGILYLDYHPRPGKRQGAWMGAYRGQQRRDGQFVAPVITNVFNFTEATENTPALLTLDEVVTLFHEFGHGLHGLLSDATYPSLAGTNVPRDFVELPSQFMENWAVEPSVLKSYAKHYKTGAVIPEALIEKMTKARHFNQGFATTEYLAASFLDMSWHTLEKSPGDVDAAAFEKHALDTLGLIPEIAPRYRSTYFAHIFAGGYSSGYYAYIWSAVLDADAFAAFKEQKILFDPATAQAFREYVLSKGNTADSMELYKKFRGADPKIEPLLERRGLTGRPATQ